MEEIEELIDVMKKSPSILSHKSDPALSPGLDPDRISCYSEKHSGDHLGVKDLTKVGVTLH